MNIAINYCILYLPIILMGIFWSSDSKPFFIHGKCKCSKKDQKMSYPLQKKVLSYAVLPWQVLFANENKLS